MGTQILNKCNVSTISILLISPFSFLSVLPLSIILVMQPPSALDFPSHSYIQKPAQEIIKKLPHLKTNRLNILEYRPVVSIIPEKKTFKEACDVCRRRKVKCDKGESCYTKSLCRCKYHPTEAARKGDRSKMMEDQGTEFHIIGNLYIGPMLSYADDQEADKFLNLLSGCTLNKYQSKNNLTRIPHPDLYHCATIEAPIISYREQISLINNYYEGSNIFNPVIDKKYLLEQHGYWYNNQTSALTPLLFYAIFAKAAYGENNPGAKGKYNKKLANHCMEYASYLAQLHSGNPRPCVLLALIIMANHLEATKLSQNMVQAWSYLRVGVDVAEGLGLYETCKFNDDTFDGQLKIRTLWLTFVTDAIMSMIYARPFNIKEKLISIKLPKVLASDDVLTAHWVNNLNKLITMSKASIRIIDHHYSSPRHLSSTNMAENHNSFLVTVDAWMENTQNPGHHSTEQEIPGLQNNATSGIFNLQQRLLFLVNLILLHRPYFNALSPSMHKQSSHQICSFAAIIITDELGKLDQDQLNYHSQSSITLYSLIVAIHIHLLNINIGQCELNRADDNFLLSMMVLQKLPQFSFDNPMNSLISKLEEQYEDKKKRMKRLKLSEGAFGLSDHSPDFQVNNEVYFHPTSSSSKSKPIFCTNKPFKRYEIKGLLKRANRKSKRIRVSKKRESKDSSPGPSCGEREVSFHSSFEVSCVNEQNGAFLFMEDPPLNTALFSPEYADEYRAMFRIK